MPPPTQIVRTEDGKLYRRAPDGSGIPLSEQETKDYLGALGTTSSTGASAKTIDSSNWQDTFRNWGAPVVRGAMRVIPAAQGAAVGATMGAPLGPPGVIGGGLLGALGLGTLGDLAYQAGPQQISPRMFGAAPTGGLERGSDALTQASLDLLVPKGIQTIADKIKRMPSFMDWAAARMVKMAPAEKKVALDIIDQNPGLNLTAADIAPHSQGANIILGSRSIGGVENAQRQFEQQNFLHNQGNAIINKLAGRSDLSIKSTPEQVIEPLLKSTETAYRNVTKQMGGMYKAGKALIEQSPYTAERVTTVPGTRNPFTGQTTPPQVTKTDVPILGPVWAPKLPDFANEVLRDVDSVLKSKSATLTPDTCWMEYTMWILVPSEAWT